MAQSFMQSFGSTGAGGPSSSTAGTYPYSTPLGPLSPYSGATSSVSGRTCGFFCMENNLVKCQIS